jgi:molybdate transport system regulatory protein
MIDLHLYLTIAHETRIGHGKVRLLEAVATTGSISAAARSLDMTYRRAWELIDHMNKAFGRPLVSGHTGSSGGAELTPLGRNVIARYRALEADARLAAAPHIAAIEAILAEQPADPMPLK